MLKRTIASLCLVLTLLLAVAVVTHHHASESESLTCSVCLVARAPAAITRIIGSQPVFLFLSTVRSEPIAAKYHVSVFALSVRPPPAA